VRGEINLPIAWLGDVPVISLQGHQVFEQRARPGRPIEPPLESPFARLQPPIDLARADGEQMTGDRGGSPAAAAAPRGARSAAPPSSVWHRDSPTVPRSTPTR
jgi:hypothetical protein